MTDTLHRDEPATSPVPVATAATRLSRLLSAGKWTVGAAITAIVAFVLAGLPLYVFPADDEVTESDLVYVIGPPTDTRLDRAHELLAEGAASEALVIGYRQGNGLYEVDEMEVCDEPAVTCGIPWPSTTKGEALLLEEYAAEHDTDKTIVITVGFHVARTRYIFDKCFDGDVAVIGVPSSGMSVGDWAYQYLYQSAAFVKAWATPCATIDG